MFFPPSVCSNRIVGYRETLVPCCDTAQMANKVALFYICKCGFAIIGQGPPLDSLHLSTPFCMFCCSRLYTVMPCNPGHVTDTSLASFTITAQKLYTFSLRNLSWRNSHPADWISFANPPFSLCLKMLATCSILAFLINDSRAALASLNVPVEMIFR